MIQRIVTSQTSNITLLRSEGFSELQTILQTDKKPSKLKRKALYHTLCKLRYRGAMFVLF